MLGLKLRDEFVGAYMPGTAISLRTSDRQGAAEKSPDHILSITYPTADVQTAIRAISGKRGGRPIVLIGDRGRGKSHLMAVMHHAVQSPQVVESWLKGHILLSQAAQETRDMIRILAHGYRSRGACDNCR